MAEEKKTITSMRREALFSHKEFKLQGPHQEPGRVQEIVRKVINDPDASGRTGANQVV
jgi:hypothetical protein